MSFTNQVGLWPVDTYYLSGYRRPIVLCAIFILAKMTPR